ncbi:MAG: hypothetical protein J3Q66DRAFT_390166 [Benniella sp.]|nr:MAG: hypothetical protein J3Q66DRAFT_390166 [Benniella sp.]
MYLWRGHMERTGQRQAKPFRLSWTQGATHHDNPEEEGHGPITSHRGCYQCRRSQHHHNCDHELIVMGSQCSGKEGTHGYSTTTMNLWRGHMERTGQRQAKPFRLSWTQGATHHDNQEEGRGPITSHRGCYQCRRLQHHHNVLVGGHMERQASANTSPMRLSWTQGANVH